LIFSARARYSFVFWRMTAFRFSFFSSVTSKKKQVNKQKYKSIWK
jgi:hypothetical protein